MASLDVVSKTQDNIEHFGNHINHQARHILQPIHGSVHAVQ